jgi:hypothetical protein
MNAPVLSLSITINLGGDIPEELAKALAALTDLARGLQTVQIREELEAHPSISAPYPAKADVIGYDEFRAFVANGDPNGSPGAISRKAGSMRDSLISGLVPDEALWHARCKKSRGACRCEEAGHPVDSEWRYHKWGDWVTSRQALLTLDGDVIKKKLRGLTQQVVSRWDEFIEHLRAQTASSPQA